MLKLLIAVTGLCSATLVGLAAAGPLDEALAAYQRHDFKTAFRLWHPLAEQGDAHAQANLAALYERGEGVARDYALAMVWYKKSADQGYVDGESGLAELYANAKGVPRNYGQAYYWYMAAANQDDAKSEFDVGLMWETGQSGVRWVPTAIWWYRQAAAHGSKDAEARIKHWFGGQEKMLNAARAAAAQGDPAAEFRLSQIYQGQFDGDNEVIWLRQAAEDGWPEAQSWLARDYESGDRDLHIEKDAALAAEWRRKATAGFALRTAEPAPK
jgi:hypothetical protein